MCPKGRVRHPMSVVRLELNCDGGQHRQYGWGRWRGELGTVLEAGPLAAGPSLKSLRVYDRYLRTSEAIGGQLASPSS